MSQENEIKLEDLTEEEQAQYREDLEERAKVLNVEFHPNISTDKLAARVAAATNGVKENQGTKEDLEQLTDVNSRVVLKPQTEFETSEDELRHKRYIDAHKLVRVQVTCHDPMKKDWQGELLETGNNAIGTIRKFVLFGHPYHLPQALVDVLKEKQYQSFYTTKDQFGNDVRKARNVPAFSVVELPALSSEELEVLKRRQLARGEVEEA